MEIEDALEKVGERMESVDFSWVVMAIRIQREVGGNLAELLNTVAETIREREYLERQVLALSAEGRLSVWILGGLPPGFMAYLLLANREYLEPLISTPIGLRAARRDGRAADRRNLLDEEAREGGRLMDVASVFLVVGIAGIFLAIILSLTAVAVLDNERAGRGEVAQRDGDVLGGAAELARRSTRRSTTGS